MMSSPWALSKVHLDVLVVVVIRGQLTVMESVVMKGAGRHFAPLDTTARNVALDIKKNGWSVVDDEITLTERRRLKRSGRWKRVEYQWKFSIMKKPFVDTLVFLFRNVTKFHSISLSRIDERINGLLEAIETFTSEGRAAIQTKRLCKLQASSQATTELIRYFSNRLRSAVITLDFSRSVSYPGASAETVAAVNDCLMALQSCTDLKALSFTEESNLSTSDELVLSSLGAIKVEKFIYKSYYQQPLTVGWLDSVLSSNEKLRHLNMMNISDSWMHHYMDQNALDSWWVDQPLTGPILAMISRLTELHIYNHHKEQFPPEIFRRVRLLLATMKNRESRLVVHQRVSCRQEQIEEQHHLVPALEFHLIPWLKLAVDTGKTLEIRATHLSRECYESEVRRLAEDAGDIFRDQGFFDASIEGIFNDTMIGLEICCQAGRLLVGSDLLIKIH